MTNTTQDLQGWIGRDLVDQSGDKIGTIAEIYYDENTDEPSWCTVKTGFFGSNVSFVPLSGTSTTGDSLCSPWDKAKVKDAPNIEPDGHISPDDERQLYAYYGIEYGAPSDTAVDRGGDVSGETTDRAMTRSEEELRVDTTSHETGRARLRKWVETEHATTTVPKSHEEVRVEREPITDANIGDALDGPEISEEVHEIPLYEEEVVVQTETVPKERVRLDKTTVTEQETVGADLRKEHIEVEGDTTRR